jgi:hypothetical protein
MNWDKILCRSFLLKMLIYHNYRLWYIMKLIVITLLLCWVFTITYRKNETFVRHINLNLLCIYILLFNTWNICYNLFSTFKMCAVFITAVFVFHVAKQCEMLYKDTYSVIIRKYWGKWQIWNNCFKSIRFVSHFVTNYICRYYAVMTTYR